MSLTNDVRIVLHTSNINIKFYQKQIERKTQTHLVHHFPATIDFKPITMHNTFFSHIPSNHRIFRKHKTYLQVNGSMQWLKYETNGCCGKRRSGA